MRYFRRLSAGEGTRTLDLFLGKEALYQLSYTRRTFFKFTFGLVGFAIMLFPHKNSGEEISYFFKDLTSGKQECVNCNSKLIPASATKLIPMVELYKQFQGKVFFAEICNLEKRVIVSVPFIPTLKAGDLCNLFAALPEQSFELYVEPKAVDQVFSKKYNLENCSKIFPLDFQTKLSFSQGKFYKQPIPCLPRENIMQIARHLNKRITVNFEKYRGGGDCNKFPFLNSDEIFRSIGSYSNNFITDLSLIFLDPKFSSLTDGLEAVVRQARNHQIILEDAVGLSRNNRASCIDFFNYLAKQKAFDLPFWHFLRLSSDYPTYKHLKDLSAGAVYAKTGTLTGVSSLVGKAVNKNSKTVFFCVMQNSEKSIEELKKREAEILSQVLSKFQD